MRGPPGPAPWGALYCRPLAAFLRRSGGSGAGFFFCVLGMGLKEWRQYLVADLLGSAVSTRFLFVAPFLLIDFVVEEELTVGRDITPAVGVEHGAIHGGV